MHVNLSNHTPLTRTEALLMLLNVASFVANAEEFSVYAVAASMIDIHDALYRFRNESIAEKMGRIP